MFTDEELTLIREIFENRIDSIGYGIFYGNSQDNEYYKELHQSIIDKCYDSKRT